MSWEVALVIGTLGAVFALLFVATTLSKEHKLIKFFLIFVGLFLLVANFGMSSHIIEANNSTITNTTTLINQTDRIYDNYLIVVYVSLLYFVLYILFNLISGRRGRE